MKTKFKLLSVLALLSTMTACSFQTIVTINPGTSSSNTHTSRPTSGENTSLPPISGDAIVSHSDMKYTYHDLFDNNYFGNVDAQPTVCQVDENGEIEPVHLLVIPVQFHDFRGNATAKTIKDIEKAYFGTPEETGWHSVSSYYYEESRGKLKMDGVVVPEWYVTNRSYKTIGNTSKDPSNTVNHLVDEAVNWYKEKYHDDCTRFDTDKDGLIDSVALIYNAPYRTRPSDNEELWAYCFWTNSTPKISSPRPRVYFWASCQFMYDDLHHCNIDAHTYIHEHGHVMGLEDYYNYDPFSNYAPIGGFTMQDHNVGGHDPFSKLAYGWMDPIVLDGRGSATIDLRSTALSGDCLVLTNKSSTEFNSPFDEYILIDFYTPEGLNEFDSKYKYSGKYPQGPKSSGLRVWHVDARLLKNFKNANRFSLATEIIDGNYYKTAMTNTTLTNPKDTQTAGYCSLVPEFRSFKLLHLLQKGGINTFAHGREFSADDMWVEGDTFSMQQYQNFFVNPGHLNSGDELNMTFEVTQITKEKATLKVTKY